MARYLTPSKVALLCLATLYTEGTVPNTSAVPVLSFLISHILPPRSSDKSPAAYRRDKKHAVSIDELEEVLSYHSSSIPGRSVWDLLLRKMWLLDCCDALETFFGDIHSIVEKSREEQIQDRDNGLVVQDTGMLLSRSSPLGAFVRRAQLEFTRLQFHDSVKLWRGFIKYRLPTYRAWARRHPSGEQSAVDVNLVDLKLDANSYLSQVVYRNIECDDDDDDDAVDDEAGVSTKDVEQLLTFQVDELQRIGGRVPDEVKDQLEYIISAGVMVPSMAHYIRFLDAWKAGDYPSSFDNLHRYFDYTVHSRDRSFYQYALLNLAILHAAFGSYAEAVSAMQEAISIARESHDMDCLNFCMSWLYHFGKAFPEEMGDVQSTGMLGGEKEGLAFLKAKARESESWGLLSTTLLSEAKLELQNGDSLAAAFENIVKSSYLNVTKNLRTTMGPLLLLQASVFSRIGLTHNALLQCEIFRECYAKGAPLDDCLKIAYRSSQLLSHSGGYKRAVTRINDVSPADLRSLKANQSWAYFCGIIKLERQIHRNDSIAVEHLFAQLQDMQLPDTDLALQLSFLEIEYRLRTGHYQESMSIIDGLAQSMKQETFDIFTQIRLLCYKARILDKTGLPQRGFSMAMRAAAIAYRSRVLPGLWEAITVLATVLLSLREFEAALEMTESIMPQVLELDNRYLTARSYSVLVDANMGLAGEASHHRIKADVIRKEYVTRALTYIDCAYDEYEAIEDLPGQCEMMAKKATVMHLSGEPVLANDYAARVLDLRKTPY
ncbi:putative anaphase-promoting complex subunit Apc5 [Talaromyces proteolyticus]|uniref:Anaphase-promoting complex subunit 5 n=1 Tax=Talaromyces proteolyticus TaxID=1131652 RepID=A0AAD4Q0C0_9EURO|nr:putative anaphase-promoting complex subunit Apc5 [Talaromyces proteolyticus]KAH8703923.1 putative anaphase-promoting complex subunit Apc5 [Talaromyces proteolyticus]